MLDLRDKLTIETPEQVTLEFYLAGIGSRFLALAFDTLLQIVIYALLLLAGAFLFPDLAKYWPEGWNWVAAVWVIAAFVLYWGYFALFEGFWNGQTPGKRHAGIRVIKDSGRSINWFEAISRNLLRVLDQVPGFYGVAVISVFLDSNNRRLGDFVAGTVVVHEEPQQEVQPVWTSPRDQARVVNSQQAVQLGVADLELIDTFLHRRLDLDANVRAATAEAIANQLSSKLKLARPADISVEDFLESLASETRNNSAFR